MIRYVFVLIAFLSTTAFSQETHWGLGTQLGVYGRVPVAGLELSMPVAENISMNYAFARGQTSLVEYDDTDVNTDLTRADFALAEASIILRALLSKTFYVGVGAGYRTLQLDYAGYCLTNGRYREGSLKSEALQARALIGNQWNFSSGVYLAVDWIGLGVPLTVTQSEATVQESGIGPRTRLTEENDDATKHDSHRLAGATMGTVLTLRLGLNF